jgi:transposase InsO family protein
VPHDTRDAVIDFTNHWSEKTEIALRCFIGWLGISASKFYDWRSRYGKASEHSGKIPRDFWIEDWERQAIIDFYRQYPLEGYRRLTFMMLDRDVVAVSPTTVWRVLRQAGLLRRFASKPSGKGKGFAQPLGPNEHWHVDVSYVNLTGTFYYLLSVLDGYCRLIVHFEIRESMTEADVEVVLERARERYPDARPRVISDNGPQFIARDFKEFVRLAGMTHVRTSPGYPQSNGKIERWHQTLKRECIRAKTPLGLEDARRVVAEYVKYYNEVRLHSALGYVTPKDMLEGRERAIFAARDRKLDQARARRAEKRRAKDIRNAEKVGDATETRPGEVGGVGKEGVERGALQGKTAPGAQELVSPSENPVVRSTTPHPVSTTETRRLSSSR